MAGNFTVHAFGVTVSEGSQPLVDLLEQIQNDDIHERNRAVKDNIIRIEDVQFLEGLWFIDFVKIRDTHGPAKGSTTKNVVGFSFADDEAFCEETAVIFDPKNHTMIVQYNHYGVKHGQIEDYLSHYDNTQNNVYTLNPKLNGDTQRDFENRKSLRSFDITLDPRELTKNDKAKGTALIDALDIAAKTEATSITISVSVGRSRTRKLTEWADKTVEKIQEIFHSNPHATSKIKAGIISSDDKIQFLDLMSSRLHRTLRDLKVGPDKRWSRSDRYNALKKVRLGWKEKLR